MELDRTLHVCLSPGMSFPLSRGMGYTFLTDRALPARQKSCGITALATGTKATILFVDDDPDFTAAVGPLLKGEGYDVHVANSCQEARAQLGRREFDVLFVDLLLPDGSGIELACDYGPRAIIITGHPSIESAIRAVRGPVIDYLVKPVDRSQLLRSIDRVLREKPGDHHAGGGDSAGNGRAAEQLLGDSPPMRKLRETISEYGATDIAVLITGESGTGKELVAEALHEARDASLPFVALNCGAIPQDLLASELFGHEKGSFTGAAARRKGLFERAGAGTVFLDEIGELPLQQQVALLRVLETGTVQRVGAEKEISVAPRILAATNRDLSNEMSHGHFREDLFYRISVLEIHVPPLRERNGDVELLARHFLAQYRAQYGTPLDMSAACLERLQAYQWPGNVRELKHVVLRAAMLNRNESVVDELPDDLERPPAWSKHAGDLTPGMSIREMEKRLIEKTLEHFDGNRKMTANALGVSLKTLYNRLRDFDSSAPGT
ncbi:MAG: sigma-54-dependent Fis family transcriptional regulator [Gammaproteobacteria bacterium]|nr:sigma-54-dependent Fis family transcriptional regulator [Gammaproteobacteria bacterium]